MGILEIHGTKGTQLQGKRILIGVTGSIAAIEIPHLVREIIRYSGEPIVILSKEATRFVTTDSLTWCMDKEPLTTISGISEHIKIVSHPGKIDLYIMCPATANSISKLANGIADGPVTLTALSSFGAGIPVLIVPAAHTVLLDNPITEKNINYLKNMNVQFTEATEEEDKYKFPPLNQLMELIFNSIHQSSRLQGKRFLITGGATREFIDDVRFLSNPSTGLSALYVAQALQKEGAAVKLILGEGNNLNGEINNISKTIVRSTEDMYMSVKEELLNNSYHGFISIAAVSDYKPAYQAGKIPSQQEKLAIELTPTRKIVKQIKQEFPDLYIVAYKAEVGIEKENLVRRGKDLLEKYRIDMVCANWVGEPEKGFASRTNELIVIRESTDSVEQLIGSKFDLGEKIVDIISQDFYKRSDT